MTTDSPHSEFILTDVRDDWWNSDFLELMASRLKLAERKRVLDVGAGHGHWGQLLMQYFSSESKLVGVEREEEWVKEAKARTEKLGLAGRATYQVGDAAKLPVEDASFDMVTCQTLLMHVADPKAAISEMKRALEPGGLLLLAEPNNLSNLLMPDSTHQKMSVEEKLSIVKFHLLVNQGRILLGEGDHSIGCRLPELLAEQGFKDIRVHLNDCASPVFSQGPSPAHTVKSCEEKVENIRKKVWLWERKEAKRLYESGGGASEEFPDDYEAFMSQARLFMEQVRSGTYSTTGGAQHYLVSGFSG